MSRFKVVTSNTYSDMLQTQLNYKINVKNVVITFLYSCIITNSKINNKKNKL